MSEDDHSFNGARIRLDVLEDIINELNKDKGLQKIFGKRVSRALFLVADNNEVRIEDRGVFDLDDKDIKLFIETLDEIIATYVSHSIEEEWIREDKERITCERDLFSVFAKKQVLNSLEKKKKALSKLSKEENKLTEDIADIRNNLHLNSVEIDALESELENIEEKAKRDFDSIKDYEWVDSLSADKNSLVVWTKPININNVEIGRFKITFSEKNGDIKNLDHPLDEVLHPHIKKRDRELLICWGNIKDEIERLISCYEFASAVHLVISFLRSYNKDDCYADLSYFEERNSRLSL